jgi:hypothetical protein
MFTPYRFKPHQAMPEQPSQKEGLPQDMKAVMKGRKVYDPRLDDTNGGAGEQRKDDPDTWAWSDNSALCVADYLVQIMGVEP